MNIRPFSFHISDDQIQDLHYRLEHTRCPDEIAGTGWMYGADLATMRELRDYWLHHFDWRAQEREIQRFAHFKADVDGNGLHFIHEHGEGANPIPLLLTHGWPGSFLEFMKIIPLLTHPSKYGGRSEDSFDVIVPSLPGFGFSDRPTHRGANTFWIAEQFHKLMQVLGYSRYAAQGGDFGANVSTVLALRHPENIIGIHLNYIPGSYRPYLGPADRLSPTEENFQKFDEEWVLEHGAYWHVQAKEPQTLGFALNDSPMGLAAWLYTKFREWADCSGDAERRFSKDELLTQISLYWFTETFTSSARLYYESGKAPLKFERDERVRVPVGVARFPFESPFPPREWAERGYNITHWTELPRGGHFAAAEEPELLAKDVTDFFHGSHRTREQ
jgi:pimeloyl-ACP methyl ester carboxylesterase